MKTTYSKDNTIADVLNGGKENIAILMGFGMHCMGCPMAQNETLEEASEGHGFDLDMLLSKLNGQHLIKGFFDVATLQIQA